MTRGRVRWVAAHLVDASRAAGCCSTQALQLSSALIVSGAEREQQARPQDVAALQHLVDESHRSWLTLAPNEPPAQHLHDTIRKARGELEVLDAAMRLLGEA